MVWIMEMFWLQTCRRYKARVNPPRSPAFNPKTIVHHACTTIMQTVGPMQRPKAKTKRKTHPPHSGVGRLYLKGALCSHPCASYPRGQRSKNARSCDSWGSLRTGVVQSAAAAAAWFATCSQDLQPHLHKEERTNCAVSTPRQALATNTETVHSDGHTYTHAPSQSRVMLPKRWAAEKREAAKGRR